jgi:hypothetical protein
MLGSCKGQQKQRRCHRPKDSDATPLPDRRPSSRLVTSRVIDRPLWFWLEFDIGHFLTVVVLPAFVVATKMNGFSSVKGFPFKVSATITSEFRFRSLLERIRSSGNAEHS